MSAFIPIDAALLESYRISAAIIGELNDLGATLGLSPIQGVVPIGICVVKNTNPKQLKENSEDVVIILMGNFAAMLGEESTQEQHVFTFRIA